MIVRMKKTASKAEINEFLGYIKKDGVKYEK